MRSNPHPRVVFAKGTCSIKKAVRALVYVPTASRAAWVEGELAREEIQFQHTNKLVDVIAALSDTDGPRPQILVVDFDSLHPAEILELHSIRDRGWTGTLFALGKVNTALRKSLRIEQVLVRLVDNALRGAISEVGFDAQTRKLPIFNY